MGECLAKKSPSDEYEFEALPVGLLASYMSREDRER